MPVSYPLCLRLEGRPCLVVGGGPVAVRKARALLEAGAVLTVVAPQAEESIDEAAQAGELDWHRRPFRTEDVRGQTLVFATTSDPGVNAAVAAAARTHRCWVNVADDPQECDFHVPASLRRGELTVAVSTGGSSPVLAAWMRDRIDAHLPPASERLVGLLARLRQLCRKREGKGIDAAPFRVLLQEDLLTDLGQDDWESVQSKVEAAFGPCPETRQMLQDFRREGR